MTLEKTGWVADNHAMHVKHGVHDIIRGLDKEKLMAFLDFRIKFLDEELNEMKKAVLEKTEKSADDVVDALIDLCVVAIGTLDLFDVDADTAWNRVHAANMAKNAGVNPNRPNEFGLPDLVKPNGWQAPSHADNVGLLANLF